MSDEITSSTPTTSTAEDAPKPKTGKSRGRPTVYTEDYANTICERISNGETLRAICRDLGLSHSTVIEWTLNNKTFADQYTQARLKQADAYADMILDEAFNAHDAQIGRLRVDALKWVASKLAPKRYGDRVEIESKSEQAITIQFQIPGRVERVQLESNVPIPPLPDASPEATDSGQNDDKIEW